jgi:arylformamidase
LSGNLRVLGVDAASPEPPDTPRFPLHAQLFEQGIIILENLVLSHVDPGPHFLVCLPLLLAGVHDGAPCRAVVLQADEAMRVP